MTCSFYLNKSQPSKFPNISSHLVFIFMYSRNPPLSPRFKHIQSLEIFHKSEPPESSNSWHIGINISRIDPNSNTRFDEFRIKIFTCILIHLIFVGNIVTTNIESNRINMKMKEHLRLVEEVNDSFYILAGFVNFFRFFALKSFRNTLLNSLVVARLVNVIDYCQGLIKLLIDNFSDISASLRMVTKSTSPSKVKIVLINNIVMMIEELILINRHPIFPKLRRFITFSRVSTSISNHNSFEIYSCLSLRQFVHFKNLGCQERNIYSCITLPRDIKLIILQFRKLSKEIDQCVVIVICHRKIIISVVGMTLAEANSSRTLQIQYICSSVP